LVILFAFESETPEVIDPDRVCRALEDKRVKELLRRTELPARKK
jgi:hypothetical protein